MEGEGGVIGRFLRSARNALAKVLRSPGSTAEPRSRWDDAEFTHTLSNVNWMASPAVLAYLNERATGHPGADWITGWGTHFCVGSDFNVLVLGCGEGWLERAIAVHGAVRHIHAVDVAAEAVGRARESAKGIDKISYGVVDLNVDTLPVDEYDVVFAHSVLHHVDNLEHAFEQIRRTMKRDAVLLVNEYAGPNRFQFTDDVLDMMNRLLGPLPERLRRGAIEKRVYQSKERPTVELMIQLDPTEAVRAEEILTFLRRDFDVLDEINVGGTILQHLLYDIVQNFSFDDPRERALLELLCTFEAALVDHSAIGCDFVLAAARKRECETPRDAYKWMRHQPQYSEADDRDPLGKGDVQRRSGGRGSHADRLPDWLLRALQIALASTRDRRGALLEQNAAAAESEQTMYAKAADATPFDWVIGRYLAVADLTDENAAAILRLLEAMEAIALEHGLVPR